jgi:hypothetical protein
MAMNKIMHGKDVKFIVQKTGHIIENYSEFYRISQVFITDYGEIA